MHVALLIRHSAPASVGPGRRAQAACPAAVVGIPWVVSAWLADAYGGSGGFSAVMASQIGLNY
jgi:hypothetical protein